MCAATLADHDRFVLTGVGTITALGSGLQSLEALVGGECCKDEHDAGAASIALGGSLCEWFTGKIDSFVVPELAQTRVLRKSLKLMNRETQMGVAAGLQAIDAAQLVGGQYDPERVGVCFGAANVQVCPSDFAAGVEACQAQSDQPIKEVWGTKGIPHIDPLWILRVLPNMPACHLAIACDFQGPSNTITQHDASFYLALSEAIDQLRDDAADAMIVGATQATSACEAAGAMVLERLSGAKRRRAPILAEVVSTASRTSIDVTHNPNPDQATSMAMAALLSHASRAGAGDVRLAIYHNQTAGTAMAQALQSSSASRRVDLSPILNDGGAAGGAIAVATGLLTMVSAEHSWDSTPEQTICCLGVTPTGTASCVSLRNIIPEIRAA